MKQEQILIVEDDPQIRGDLADILCEKGFAVSASSSAEDAIIFLGAHHVDLVLLDVLLPGASGFELCRKLRSATGGPRIIMLTALSEPIEKVKGLELGADDYVSKPFDIGELVARVRAVLRRHDAKNAGSSVLREGSVHFGDFTFFPHRRFLRAADGLRVPLTGAEADLLLVFCQNAGCVLSRGELIELTRGEGFAIAARSVDLLVSRLRRKLSREASYAVIIQTVRADGYLFHPKVIFE